MPAGPSPNSTPSGEGPSGKPLPLSVRLLAAGVRGARDVGKATGLDQAIELAAEEAMVAAVESEAVERAIARVLKGPVVEEAMNSALESDHRPWTAGWSIFMTGKRPIRRLPASAGSTG